MKIHSAALFLTPPADVRLLDIHILLSRLFALLLGVYRNIMIRCNPWRYVWQYITSIIYLEIPIVYFVLRSTGGRDLGKRKLDVRVDAPVALLNLTLADAA